MSASDLFSILIQGLFIALSAVTALDWFRHRDMIRRDIALMFGSLGLVFLIQVFERINGSELPVLNVIEGFSLLSQPYLLLRLVRYFQPVPQRIMRIALAAMVICWVSLLVYPAIRSAIILVVVIAYFAGVNGYSMVSFVRGALTTSGVVRQRMRFGAVGSGLLALTLVLVGVIVLIAPLRDVGTAIGVLFAIVAALSFYVAFAPPRWLRRTWQMDELRTFLVAITRRSAAERLNPVEATSDLCAAAIRAIGGSSAVVLQASDTGWKLRSTGDAALASIEKDGEEVFNRTWQQRSASYIRLAKASSEGERRIYETSGADTMFLIPITTLERDWGLLVVFRKFGSLFIDDDLNLLTLLAQQNAILLENSTLVEELRAHSQKLEQLVDERTALLESAPDAMIVVNSQAEIEMVNAQTEKMFGYTRDDLLGQPIELLIPESIRGRHREHRDKYIAAPRSRAMGVGLELYALHRDGNQIPVEISLSPLETAQGIQIISAVRDITERKRMEELRSLNVELQQRVLDRTAQLEATNKELESFSYSVSHDLRAPLRTLDGFSQALLEDYSDKLDETGQNLLRRIRAGSQRMGQLIDDLLQLSRLSRAEMRMTQVDLSTMAQEIANELREQNPSRDVKFIVADGLVVKGDTRLLRVALGNLLGNAWKFTGKQSEACVEFGVTEQEQKRVFFVRDNGAGFDMAYADKLFGAFQRLHGMTEFEGTGIGLATVQRVLVRHGGRIWAEAAVNKGATFYFTV